MVCRSSRLDADDAADDTAYGLDVTMAGHRNVMNAAMTIVPRTPIMETGANAARDGNCTSGSSTVVVIPKMDACRVAQTPPETRPDPFKSPLSESPMTRLKVRQHPRQYTKFAAETIQLVSFFLDEEVVLVKIRFQISPRLLAPVA